MAVSSANQLIERQLMEKLGDKLSDYEMISLTKLTKALFDSIYRPQFKNRVIDKDLALDMARNIANALQGTVVSFYK